MSLNLVTIDFQPFIPQNIKGEGKMIRGDLELLKALDDLARTRDNDFNGKNGKDYLYEDAKDEGYECNADYVFNYIKENIENGYYDKYGIVSIRYSTIVEDYLYMWLGKNGYYENYNYCQPNLGCFVIAWNDGEYY